MDGNFMPKIKRILRLKHVPSQQEYEAILQHFRDHVKSHRSKYSRWRSLRDYIIVRCIAELGLRLSEALCLKLEDLDFKTGYIRIIETKTMRERSVYMNDSLKSCLQVWVNEHAEPRSGFLFTSHSTTGCDRLNTANWSWFFVNCIQGMPLQEVEFESSDHRKFRRITAHSLRRYFCRQLREKNPTAPLDKLALVTGHKNLDVLRNFYIRLDAKSVQKELIEKTFV